MKILALFSWLKSRTETNYALYWKQGAIWVVGLLITVPGSGAFARWSTANPQIINPELTPFIAPAILMAPFIVVGAYGLRHEYCAGLWMGIIYRGGLARAFNLFFIAVYFPGVWGIATNDFASL
ncbi:MAG: hypothetical protein GKS02_06370 [Alphaproteobacteria bacterium]|nr:hypothetical protein [Alphaproteobacteria bacterium]